MSHGRLVKLAAKVRQRKESAAEMSGNLKIAFLVSRLSVYLCWWGGRATERRGEHFFFLRDPQEFCRLA